MEPNKVTHGSLKDVPESAWKKLSDKKIFFGHQSVGKNIVAGIEDLNKENQRIRLNIVEAKEIKDSKKGVFVHSSNLGKNEHPETKIQDFHAILHGGVGKKIDVAGMKFCYVDVDAKTDIKEVFEQYREEIKSLKLKFPDLEFIHFTVPLLRQNKKSGLKGWIKKILGKNSGFFANEHNIARNKFNDLILNEYHEEETVFNIAEIESTFPDGTRCFFKENGKVYYSLVPEYTDDGGHLNELGRIKVAEQLLLLLANLD